MLKPFGKPAAMVALVMSLAIMLAFAASLGLTLAKFSDTLKETVTARYAIHAADLRSDIETGINLGLELEEIGSNVEVVVRNRLALDEGIERVVLTGPDGRELFSMSRGDAGLAWPVEAGQLSRNALPIVNSFGATVGEVAIFHAEGETGETVREAAGTLFRYGAVLASASAAIASAWCFRVMAPLSRSMRIGRARLASAAAGPAPDTASSAGSTGGPVDRLARQAAQSASATLSEIGRIEAALAVEARRRAP